MNFAIGIPTYNRMDLLLPSVIKYITTDFPEVNIHIIDNGNQHIKFLETMPNIKVYEEKENIGVAASWNKLCKKIYEKHDFALIVNDDVYLGYNTKVVEKAMAECQSGFSQSNASWSVFLMHKEFYDFVGDFDEIFYPAYYEDSDYLYRMKLLGINLNYINVDKLLSVAKFDRVVIVERKNLTDCCVSLCLAYMTSKYHYYDKSVSIEPFECDSKFVDGVLMPYKFSTVYSGTDLNLLI
jgi:GT2 family glycosyltransferase